MNFTEFEYFSRVIYYKEYALNMEMRIPDPNECPFPYILVFDLDRIEDFRDAIDHGYLDVAASQGDLYRVIPLHIVPEGHKTFPSYERYRTRMQEANGYAVEMQTELNGIGSVWAAGVSPQDSARMKEVRKALEAEDLETAAQYGKVYRLEPVDVTPLVEPWQPSRKETGQRTAPAAPRSTG
ncbi:MAG: hypothetical protein F4W95_10255 [Chloroflexi bacterium]|nr:hypothetical protein [Chloroflexota bacterium]MYD48854.1 hypothetical protein [Chloroflexota bacterium]